MKEQPIQKKLLKQIFAVVLFCAIALTGYAQKRVVGYTQSWDSKTDFDYNVLTHINYSFALPNWNGGLEPIENDAKLRTVISKAHNNGVKVLIAIGGWDLGDGGGVDTRFVNMAANASTRASFVNSVISFIDTYGLDGVDIDWEYPEPVNGAPDGNYTALMRELSNAMHSRGKLLTAAVVASGWTGDGISAEVFDYIDWLNLMAYDGDNGAGHSPYSYAVSSLDYWLGRGLPKSKAVLGLPFYARPSWNEYRTLLSMGADPYSDTFNGDYYNGINTIKSKTALGVERGAGVMIWSIDHDTNNQYSLLKAIGEEMGNNDGGDDGGDNGGGDASSLTIEAENYSNMSGIENESCTEGGQNVAYVDSGDWMAYANITFPTSATYTIQYRVASETGGGVISADLNSGSTVLGTVNVPATGGWQTWTTVSQTVNVNAGTYSFGVFAQTGGWNLNWIKISSPNIFIEAESFSSMSGIETEACSEGGQNIGYVADGDWMAYSGINFPTSGTYKIEYRVATETGGTISADLNSGSTVLGTVNVPVTGGWQTWATISQTVNITAGTHSFGLYAQVGGWNLNWIRITPVSSAARSMSNAKESTIELFPNPVVDDLKFTTNGKTYHVKVIAVNGQVVVNQKLHNNQLNVSKLKPGVYTIQLESNEEIITKRFIKQ